MKWASAIARSITDEPGTDASVEVDIASFNSGAIPTLRQLDEIGVIGPHLVVDDSQVCALIAGDYDVLVVNTVGSRLHRVSEALRHVAANSSRRPVLVTGYAGVVYEKHVEGAVWRAGADVICCNSAVDYELFSEVYRSLGVPIDALVRSGLAVVQMAPDLPTRAPTASGDVSVVTFAVQPDVPRSRNDRIYLLERLAAYARAHPERSVIVKLRSRPDEVTTHRERFHFEELYRSRVVDRPPNLSFEYGLMSSVLERTDLLVTVSSTAALEAISLGVPVAILADMGVGEALGNHFFLGSGLLSSMNLISQDKLPVVDPDWLRRNGFGGDDRLSNVAAKVLSLLGQQEQSGRPLPVPPGFVNDEMTPRLAALASSPPNGAGTGIVSSRRARNFAARYLPSPAARFGLRLERKVASWW